MIKKIAVAATVAALIQLGGPAVLADEQEERWKRSPEVWETPRRPGSRSISGYEEEQRAQQPPKEAVLFAGSATIWMWDLEKWFPDFETINRGYGGSMISDSTHFADRIIIPHEPAVIVIYAGDNDVWLGKPPDITAKHFADFVEKIRLPLPRTQIVFISIRPSISRWEVVDKFREANRLIKKMVDADDRLSYADIDPLMLGSDGKPRPDLLHEDLLHLSDEGYRVWTSVVTPLIEKALESYQASAQRSE